MHSQRSSKPKMISASVPKTAMIDKDWETDFTFEEDYIPDNLKDLLTPQEKARRMSRNADDEVSLCSFANRGISSVFEQKLKTHFSDC